MYRIAVCDDDENFLKDITQDITAYFISVSNINQDWRYWRI